MTEHQALSTVETFARDRGMLPVEVEAALRSQIVPKDKEGKSLAMKADVDAFLMLCMRFNLDPWAREIFLISTKGGIRPYISVDGYTTIVNRQPEYDGCTFDYEQTPEGGFLAVTCTMYRKDRTHPVIITEFMSECMPRGDLRDDSPWRKWPARMLRHRAFIQAVRMSFGLGGAFDFDGDEGPTIDVTRAAAAFENVERPPPRAKKEPPQPTPSAGDPKKEKQASQEQAKPDEDKPEEGHADVETFVNDLHDRLNEAADVKQLDDIWLDMDPITHLQPNKKMIEYAQSLYAKAKAKLEAKETKN